MVAEVAEVAEELAQAMAAAVAQCALPDRPAWAAPNANARPQLPMAK